MKKFPFLPARVLLVLFVGTSLLSCVRTEYVQNPIIVSGGQPKPVEDLGIIEFPEGSSLKAGDIELYGDGQPVTVSKDGYFDASSSTLLAINDNHVVYLSYCIPEVPTTLNSIETAISLLLPTVPHAATNLNKDQLWVFKQIIGHMEETKKLADAIDESLIRKNHIDMSAIETQLSAASKAVASMLGINQTVNGSPARRTAANTSYPYFTSTGSNQTYGDGFTVKMEDSTIKEENGKKFEDCTFTILNADRFVYTSFTKSYKAENGRFNRMDSSMSDTFLHIVKPMNVSAFMDFGTLSDIVSDPAHFVTYLSEPDFERIVNHIKEPLQNFGRMLRGEATETVTFDKTKLENVKFRFYSRNEHLAVVGPGSDDNLVLYNILKIVFQPIMKFMIEVEGVTLMEKDTLLDEVICDFITWMIIEDHEFGREVLAAFTHSGYTWTQKMELLPEIGTHFRSFINKALVTGFVDKLYSKILFSNFTEEAWQSALLLFKSVLIGGDLLQMGLDLKYYGVAFELTHLYSDVNGWADDIPGNEIN